MEKEQENKKDWLLRVVTSIHQQFEEGLGNPPEDKKPTKD